MSVEYCYVTCRDCGDRQVRVRRGYAISGDEPIAVCRACRVDGSIHPEHELNSDDAPVSGVSADV